jgi:hypothetical protein
MPTYIKLDWFIISIFLELKKNPPNYSQKIIPKKLFPKLAQID